MNAIVLAAAFMMAPHATHETVSEIQWNATEKTVEVAIRIDAIDAYWIRRHQAEQATAGQEGSKPLDRNQLQLAYVKKHLTFWPTDEAETTKPKAKPVECNYRWIGSKLESGHVWWFIEIKPKDGERPPRLGNTMLFDRDDSYRNLIVLLDAKKDTRATSPKKPTTLW